MCCRGDTPLALVPTLQIKRKYEQHDAEVFKQTIDNINLEDLGNVAEKERNNMLSTMQRVRARELSLDNFSSLLNIARSIEPKQSGPCLFWVLLLNDVLQ